MRKIETPLNYSHVLHRTRMVLDNALSTMDRELVSGIYADVIGKNGTFYEPLLTLAEKNLYNMLTELYAEATINGLGQEFQITVLETLEPMVNTNFKGNV